ncbi:hypothetical protein NX059_000375 [Plenodomus lindquistii]|nr:hypothetical protein NX059_000375 [Plenodomus lindquistii]
MGTYMSSTLHNMRACEQYHAATDGQKGLSTPYARSLLQRMWAIESEFSEARLCEVRAEQTASEFPHKHYDDGFMRDHIFTEGPIPFAQRGPVIDNAIHPIFSLAKFDTPLPMHEISEQMAPALRLASHMITHPRALEWFAHVRHAHTGRSRNGRLVTLVHNPFSNSAEALQTVKDDLLQLAEVINFQWFGDAMPFTPGAGGLYTKSLAKTVEFLEKARTPKSEDGPLTDGQHYLAGKTVEDAFCPIIWLHVTEFHHFLRQSNQKDYPARLKRLTDFKFAKLIIHELAHAWVSFCRPDDQASFKEPLILQSDLFQEAGASWEHFMFGASIYAWPRIHNGRSIIASLRTMARNDRDFEFTASIPQAWVDQWFLRQTWDQFDALHRDGKQFHADSGEGKLCAPAPCYQNEHWRFRHYCGRMKKVGPYVCHKGKLVCHPCGDPGCDAIPRRFAQQDSMTPVEIRQAYLKIVEENRVLAIAAGRSADEINLPGGGNYDGAYAHARRMAIGSEPADDALAVPF